MKTGIIGCGNMGQAIVAGILDKGLVKRENLLISDRDIKVRLSVHLRYKVGITDSNDELIQKSDVIILAVKPQDVKVLAKAVSVPLKGKLLISICAGITLAKLEDYFGKIALVRVMPNLPAVISQGISAVASGKYAKRKDSRRVVSIFSSVGEVVQVKENLLDAVTAISGSGPAYFFYLTEKLIETAQKMGISSTIAQRLAVKTALGSAIFLDRAKKGPRLLREKVSSRGGTTEAAFKIFKKRGLDRILSCAFKAAAKRAKELQD